MTIIEIAPAEVTEETTGDAVYHLACCMDKQKAVCGTPVVSSVEEEKDIDCVVCLDLGHNAVRHLARTGHVHCPLNFNVFCPKEMKP